MPLLVVSGFFKNGIGLLSPKSHKKIASRKKVSTPLHPPVFRENNYLRQKFLKTLFGIQEP